MPISRRASSTLFPNANGMVIHPVAANPIAANLSDIELEGGPKPFDLMIHDKLVRIFQDVDDFRYIIAGHQFHKVRNIPHFEAYHHKHPGALKELLRMALFAQSWPQNILDASINNKANKDFRRPYYISETPKNAWGNIRELVPVSSLLELNITWLKGLLIQSQGAAGFDLIKQAKKEADEQTTLEVQKAFDAATEHAKQELERKQKYIHEAIIASIPVTTPSSPTANENVYTEDSFNSMLKHIDAQFIGDTHQLFESFGQPYTSAATDLSPIQNLFKTKR